MLGKPIKTYLRSTFLSFNKVFNGDLIIRSAVAYRCDISSISELCCDSFENPCHKLCVTCRKHSKMSKGETDIKGKPDQLTLKQSLVQQLRVMLWQRRGHFGGQSANVLTRIGSRGIEENVAL